MTEESYIQLTKAMVTYKIKHLQKCHQNVLVFTRATLYASAGLCDSDVSVRPSVRRTPVLCLAERKQDREMYTI